MINKVRLEVDQIKKVVKIQNSKITICFDFHGNATSLKYNSRELLNHLTGEPTDPDKYHSFYCDYHMNGKTYELDPQEIKVISQQDNLVHIAFVNQNSELSIEYHILLRVNDSAIYSYIIAKNMSNQVLKVNELRTVYRFDPILFQVGFNGERMGMQPASKLMMRGRKLQDETYLMKNGSLYSNSRIYSKYDYAGYFKNSDFWGQFGKEFGAWLIAPTKDYYGSGPLNQDLMIHYDGLILNYLFSEHFGKGLNKLPINWQKMYGPWCLYLNNGDLSDALERSNQEIKNIPYPWIQEDQYPRNLYSLNGNLVLELKSKFYQLILMSAKKEGKEIVECQNTFTYSAKSCEDGKFEINNIRPGKYWLYAYALDGDDVEIHCLAKGINVDQDIQLSNLIIKAKTSTIWQIGFSSQTTSGFVFSDQLRNYIWHNLVPKNLIYHVDQNDDWYYLQNDQGKWQIVFDLKRKLSNGELQISLAGATQKKMEDTQGVIIKIWLNDKKILNRNLGNDRSAYRSAILSGRHCLLKIPLMKVPVGNNVITIKTNGYLMYDTIKLVERKARK